jgi:hypothetical protein
MTKFDTNNYIIIFQKLKISKNNNLEAKKNYMKIYNFLEFF